MFLALSQTCFFPRKKLAIFSQLLALSLVCTLSLLPSFFLPFCLSFFSLSFFCCRSLCRVPGPLSYIIRVLFLIAVHRSSPYPTLRITLSTWFFFFLPSPVSFSLLAWYGHHELAGWRRSHCHVRGDSHRRHSCACSASMGPLPAPYEDHRQPSSIRLTTAIERSDITARLPACYLPRGPRCCNAGKSWPYSVPVGVHPRSSV